VKEKGRKWKERKTRKKEKRKSIQGRHSNKCFRLSLV